MLFRKIHGRVIPIREKGEQSNSSKAVHTALGAGAVAGGIALGGYAGNKAADLTVKSAYAEHKARKYAEVAKKAIPHSSTIAGQAAIKSAKNHKKSEALLKTAFRVKTLGPIGAATLIGYGTNKILSQTQLKERDDARITASAAAAGLTAFAVESKYLRGVGNRRRDALKKAVKLAVGAFRARRG